MVQSLGWSAVEGRAHTLRLPKWRSRALGARYPNATAIGHSHAHHRPAAGVGGGDDDDADSGGGGGDAVGMFPGAAHSPHQVDERALLRIVIDGRDRVLQFERGLSGAEAMSEGRWFCAWNAIREANCPRSIAAAIQAETY